MWLGQRFAAPATLTTTAWSREDTGIASGTQDRTPDQWHLNPRIRRDKETHLAREMSSWTFEWDDLEWPFNETVS